MILLGIVNPKLREFQTSGYVREARRFLKMITKNVLIGSNMINNNALHQK